ncbi:hypothetical protein C3943_08400 [Lysinibacillus sp. B2A1]|nr:hypothetical protein C3943_08400 [Lysinibacillus sp. B2A1]
MKNIKIKGIKKAVGEWNNTTPQSYRYIYFDHAKKEVFCAVTFGSPIVYGFGLSCDGEDVILLTKTYNGVKRKISMKEINELCNKYLNKGYV